MIPAVALVGLGDIALGAHLPALLRNHDVRIAALVDPDAERREAAAAAVGAPSCADLSEVDDVDGVVLATPPWVTTGLVVEAARAGKFVLAEKPIATSLAEAKALDALTGSERARVQVGLTYRHDPALELLREWIAEGRLGGPLLVRAHIYDERRDESDPAHAARLEETLRHGMPVVHEGAHVFDWFSFLFGGPPSDIRDGWSIATRQGLAEPNLCGARLDYPQGTVVLAEFGWLTGALPRCEISVLGDRGHVLLDGRTFDLTLDDGRSVEKVAFEPDRATRCFDRQLTRFVELMTGVREKPSPDLADGIAALATSERVATEMGAR